MDPEPHQSPGFEGPGSVIGGMAIGCGIQIVFLIVAFVLSSVATASKSHLPLFLILSSWGVTQWIALIPLILNERGKGKHETVTGMLIIGCIGLLLSSACAMAIRG